MLFVQIELLSITGSLKKKKILRSVISINLDKQMLSSYESELPFYTVHFEKCFPSILHLPKYHLKEHKVIMTLTKLAKQPLLNLRGKRFYFF